MAVDLTSTKLYPSNGTVVDSGTGVDIRLLTGSPPAGSDTSQAVQWDHTQDNNGRVFDPATTGVTLAKNVGSSLTTGWALRLAEDCTPTDDTNFNVILPAGSYQVTFSVALNQSGGTYAAGSYGPTFYAALWRYNPTTNVSNIIGSVQGSAAVTWNYGVGSDLGTFKTITIPNIVLASNVELQQGEVLALELGLNTNTCPNPTLGTATWTATLSIGQSTVSYVQRTDGAPLLAQVAYMQGSSAGAGAAPALGSIVKGANGASAGVGSQSGVLSATAEMQGSAAGAGAASAAFGGIGEMQGAASGSSTAPANTSKVLGTVGAVDIGGGQVPVYRPIILFDD